MKNNNIDLYEILKGHEGEMIFSETFGNVVLNKIQDDSISIIPKKYHLIDFKCDISEAIQDLFPSKEQKDWEKWDKENNCKTPKTWSQIRKCNVEILGAIKHLESNGPIESICKSALTLLKIHQLIDAGYGGNVTDEEWKIRSDKWLIIPIIKDNKISFIISRTCYFSDKGPIAFHTRKYAEEFLSYPENIKLLKNYFMI